jgi:hypothetical protein
MARFFEKGGYLELYDFVTNLVTSRIGYTFTIERSWIPCCSTTPT